MRQVFRLMGMPDKVIAFDELPNDLLDGLEWRDDSKLPKEWRDFIGYREKSIKIRPELNPITRQWETYPALTQKAPFTFLIDWEVNHDKEKWAEIESYVKRNAPKDFRLMDKIVDMAKPMAADAHAELSLEVSDIITIPLEKTAEIKTPESASVTVAPTQVFACSECGKEFDSKQGVVMHKNKKHSAITEQASTPVPQKV